MNAYLHSPETIGAAPEPGPANPAAAETMLAALQALQDAACDAPWIFGAAVPFAVRQQLRAAILAGQASPSPLSKT